MWTERLLKPTAAAFVFTLTGTAAPLTAQGFLCEHCTSAPSCVPEEVGANDCNFYEGPDGNPYCAPNGGLCGFDAVAMSGQVVFPIAPADLLSSGSVYVADEDGTLRRACDAALVQVVVVDSRPKPEMSTALRRLVI